MSFSVHLIIDAENDIRELYEYVKVNDSTESAFILYQNIKKEILSLQQFPLRGHFPPELERINIKSYREIHYKPYRIIYQILEENIYVHCILDGRRELFELLERRLLR